MEAGKRKKILKKNVAFKLSATFFYLTLHARIYLTHIERHMNKRIKWGIIILIGAGLAGLGIYQFTPHENEELTAADALPKENKQRTLKVNES